MVVVGGTVLVGTSELIATLPRDFRPTRRLVFLVDAGHDSARVDVTADGRILYKAGPRAVRWIGLSGVVFACEPLRTLPWP